MLNWAVVFFVVAIVASFAGMGIPGGAATIAQGLFVFLLVMFALSLVSERRRGPAL